jgi:transcriptional regulator with XRE-family HTH domain
MTHSPTPIPLISLKSPHKSFNELIRDLREQAGYSIAAIAERLDIHRNSQANYESNRVPSIEYLVEFSAAVSYPFWANRVKKRSFFTEWVEPWM